jgi:hypothetical protein
MPSRDASTWEKKPDPRTRERASTRASRLSMPRRHAHERHESGTRSTTDESSCRCNRLLQSADEPRVYGRRVRYGCRLCFSLASTPHARRTSTSRVAVIEAKTVGPRETAAGTPLHADQRCARPPNRSHPIPSGREERGTSR